MTVGVRWIVDCKRRLILETYRRLRFFSKFINAFDCWQRRSASITYALNFAAQLSVISELKPISEHTDRTYIRKYVDGHVQTHERTYRQACTDIPKAYTNTYKNAHRSPISSKFSELSERESVWRTVSLFMSVTCLWTH